MCERALQSLIFPTHHLHLGTFFLNDCFVLPINVLFFYLLKILGHFMFFVK